MNYLILFISPVKNVCNRLHKLLLIQVLITDSSIICLNYEPQILGETQKGNYISNLIA